jgi:hypothetical protein
MTLNHLTPQELTQKTLLRVLAGISILATMFFLPAGTIFYWEALGNYTRQAAPPDRSWKP